MKNEDRLSRNTTAGKNRLPVAFGLVLFLSLSVLAADAFAQSRSRGATRTQPAERADTLVVRPDRPVSPQAEERQRSRAVETRQRAVERERENQREQQVQSQRQQQRAQEAERQRQAQAERQREEARAREAERQRQIAHQQQQQQIRRHYQTYPVFGRVSNFPFHIDVWTQRHSRGWSPRYVYRQVLYTEAGWSRFTRTARIDAHTYMRQRIRRVSRDRVEMEVYVERIVLHENGRYVGEVSRIPGNMRTVRGTLYRNGYIDMDRMLYIVGDTRAGFELISTRHYDGFLYDAYVPAHGMRVARLDLRRDRAVAVRNSRLFNPRAFDGFVPAPLLPEDNNWIGGYGDRFAYGRPSGGFFGSFQNDPLFHSSPSSSMYQSGEPQQRTEARFRTRDGADILIRREAELQILGEQE